jgi:Tfp pilus assembly protein PilF
MEGKSPSLGYSLLAEIIQHTRHKVVVTTNFDNLVADALAMHAHQSPLVVAHESLAGFVRPQLRRPLVAKIHRDLFLHPINDAAGVSNMEEGWKIALKKLFQYFTPVVVGYGGNDGSLMELLSSLDAGDIAGRMVWCYREGATSPAKALAILRKHNGLLVKIPGFDEFMLQLAAKLVAGFDVAAIAERTAKLGQERAERYREQAKKLRETSSRGSAAEQKAGAVLSESVRLGNSWWAWEMKALSAPGVEERQRIYLDGLQQFPSSAELTCNYANFLVVQRKDFDGADAQYQKALELDPSDEIIIGNYASFLANQRKDFNGAEEMFKKALELDPNNTFNLANYALFLKRQLKDYDGAEAMYKKVLELDPGNANNSGNYAVFLENQRKDYDGAEALYKMAIELDPRNANISGNYGAFLTIQRKDFSGAEALFKKAIELDPSNPINRVNYAGALLIRGDDASVNAVLPLVQSVLEQSRPAVSQAVAEALMYDALVQEIVPGAQRRAMLARLKGALLAGYARDDWDFSPMFAAVLPRLPAPRREFFLALGEAILDPERLPALDAMQPWREVQAIDPFAP